MRLTGIQSSRVTMFSFSENHAGMKWEKEKYWRLALPTNAAALEKVFSSQFSVLHTL